MGIVIWLLVAGAAAWVGATVASRNNRNAAAWGIICFLFPLIGLIIVFAIGEAPKPPELAQPRPEYDWKKWQALVEYDPDIKAAAQSLEPHGQKYVDQLAEKYLALNDKAFLPQIREKLLAAAAAEAAELGDTAYLAEMCARVRDLYITPRGKIVVLRDGSVLAEVMGQIKLFADTATYREETRQGSSIWDEVTDNATRREFIERFRDHWPQS